MSGEEKRNRPDVTFTQVIAGALAAVTAAALGAQLGVAGTIIGAAVASVVSTVGSALYQHSLERSRAAAKALRTDRKSVV